MYTHWLRDWDYTHVGLSNIFFQWSAMYEKYTVAEGDTERGEQVATTFYSLRREAGGPGLPTRRLPWDESSVGLTEPTPTHRRVRQQTRSYLTLYNFNCVFPIDTFVSSLDKACVSQSCNERLVYFNGLLSGYSFQLIFVNDK